MTDFLEVSGPGSLAALVSAIAPDQPRPLGTIASVWLKPEVVFAVAQSTGTEGDEFVVTIRPTRLGHDSDIRMHSRQVAKQLRDANWTVHTTTTEDRAIA